jgi:hypothetical protein
MPNIEPFFEGQEVFLKRPIQIYAKVIGAFEGDSGLPGGLLCYAVQLLPLEQIYLPEDLEPSCRPQPAQPQPEDVSPKEAEEFAPAAELERAAPMSCTKAGDPRTATTPETGIKPRRKSCWMFRWKSPNRKPNLQFVRKCRDSPRRTWKYASFPALSASPARIKGDWNEGRVFTSPGPIGYFRFWICRLK